MILTISHDEINDLITRSPKTRDILELVELNHDAAVFKIRFGVPVKVTLSRFRIEDNWVKTEMRPKFLGFITDHLANVDPNVLKISSGVFEMRLPASITERIDIQAVIVQPGEVMIEGVLK